LEWDGLRSHSTGRDICSIVSKQTDKGEKVFLSIERKKERRREESIFIDRVERERKRGRRGLE